MLQASTRTPSAPFGRAAVLTLIAAAVLSACGGGGGDPGTVPPASGGTGTSPTAPTTPVTPTVPATPTVTLSMLGAGGQASNSLSGATPLTVQATVKDASGKPVADELVTFATDGTLAVFSPSAGTALTNAEGVARVTMRAASLAGSGAAKLNATVNLNGTAVIGERNYQVGATTLTFGALSTSLAQIQAYNSTELSVEVLAGGVRYTDQPVKVNFTSACLTAGKATLATTVSTNGGIAKTVYRDQGCANDDVITVTADGVSVPATAPLKIAPPTAASVQFVSAEPVEKSIVIQGQGGINRTETATLKFRVFDTFGNPLARREVKFRVSEPALVRLNKVTDSTDENGEVITTVNSGAVATTFRVFATLPNTATATLPDISTTSDSIVVTTGLPVQRAFSLSAGTYNLEGWTRDSSPTVPATQVQVMIADSFGNPVPDGTPVVFQTNMGSIGSSDKGGCNTINGGCSVDFRTQNPRVAQPNQPATPCNTGTGTSVSDDSIRRGLATICASSTDGSNTIFSKIGLFFGGSSASKVYMDGTALTNNVTDLGTVRAVDSKVFVLQLNDVNLNPLPFGTRVEVSNAVNAVAAAVVPATVPNIYPHSDSADDITGVRVSGRQGSSHTFTVSNGNGQGCTAPVTATFNVTVTTPGNVVTTIPFKLTFSCP
jgi:hypothetical protein